METEQFVRLKLCSWSEQRFLQAFALFLTESLLLITNTSPGLRLLLSNKYLCFISNTDSCLFFGLSIPKIQFQCHLSKKASFSSYYSIRTPKPSQISPGYNNHLKMELSLLTSLFYLSWKHELNNSFNKQESPWFCLLILQMASCIILLKLKIFTWKKKLSPFTPGTINKELKTRGKSGKRKVLIPVRVGLKLTRKEKCSDLALIY